MMTMVKVNYKNDAHNNVKNYFDTDIPKKFENWSKNTENSQKPAKRQS